MAIAYIDISILWLHRFILYFFLFVMCSFFNGNKYKTRFCYFLLYLYNMLVSRSSDNIIIIFIGVSNIRTYDTHTHILADFKRNNTHNKSRNNTYHAKKIRFNIQEKIRKMFGYVEFILAEKEETRHNK